jgi:hypothetical protein
MSKLPPTFFIVWEWVSKWLLFNSNSAIFQLYHDENKLIFNGMMMKSALYWDQHAELDFYSVSSPNLFILEIIGFFK